MKACKQEYVLLVKRGGREKIGQRYKWIRSLIRVMLLTTRSGGNHAKKKPRRNHTPVFKSKVRWQR
jgi:hypothetical protein